MKPSRFTEEQIIGILREHEAGAADTQQIAMHPASHHVPSRVQSRLKDIGYVKEVLGGLVLTDDGAHCDG